MRCPEGWKQVPGAPGQKEEPLLPPQGRMHSPQGGVRVGNLPSPGSVSGAVGRPQPTLTALWHSQVGCWNLFLELCKTGGNSRLPGTR